MRNRMQVAVTPTGTDRSAITNPKGTSPGQSLLELSSVGGDRHRQRQFESPSNSFQLTVTHSVSSGLERILSSFVDSRRETRRSLSAAPSRPPLLLSVASALLFLVLDAIFSANQSSRRANQIFEPKIFLRCRGVREQVLLLWGRAWELRSPPSAKISATTTVQRRQHRYRVEVLIN